MGWEEMGIRLDRRGGVRVRRDMGWGWDGDGMGWDGMEWNRMGWNGMRRD